MIIKENEAFYGVRLPIDSGKPLVLPQSDKISIVTAKDANGSAAKFAVLNKPVGMPRDEIAALLSEFSDAIKKQKGVFSPPVQVTFTEDSNGNGFYIVNDLERLWDVQDKDFVAAYDSAMLKSSPAHTEIEEEYANDNRDF